MSIIETGNPLNLSYKVIVVTNASSAIGIVVCNTLLKANALVLGTDRLPKDESFSASNYSHFQFHQCKLDEEGAADRIIADAKRKFRVDRIDGLVNLASGDDGAEMQAAYKTLATACAAVMDAGIDGGAVVNALSEAALASAGQPGVTAVKGFREICSEISSDKVRCNMIAPNDKKSVDSCKEYEDSKQHFKFLFSRLSNQQSTKESKAASEEKQAIFDFSNIVLFLISRASQDIHGISLDRFGKLL